MNTSPNPAASSLSEDESAERFGSPIPVLTDPEHPSIARILDHLPTAARWGVEIRPVAPSSAGCICERYHKIDGRCTALTRHTPDAPRRCLNPVHG